MSYTFEDVKIITKYIKTFNEEKLKEEYEIYCLLDKPTFIEYYFKNLIKKEIKTRGIRV
jgi:hypothetical protein